MTRLYYLTATGRELRWRKVSRLVRHLIDSLPSCCFGHDSSWAQDRYTCLLLPAMNSRSTSMKLSARNALPGIVRKIAPGAVNAEVTIELAPGLIVVSVITLDAVNSLQLKVGDHAYAVIKASSVMIAVD